MPSACSLPCVWYLLTLAALALAGCAQPTDDLDPGQAELEKVHTAMFAAATGTATGDPEGGQDSTEAPVRRLDGLTTSTAPGHLSGTVRHKIVTLLAALREGLADGGWHRDPGTQQACPDCVGPIAEQMCPDCILIFPDEEEPIIPPRFHVEEVSPDLEPMFPEGLAVLCPDCVDVEIQVDAPGNLGTLTDVDRVHIPAGSFHPRGWHITPAGLLHITLVLPSADMAPPAKARLALELMTAGPWGNPASHTVTDVPWHPVSVEPAEPFRIRSPDTVAD